MFVLIFIMIWCFYHIIEGNIQDRNKLLWVEVQDFVGDNYRLTRMQSKLNLQFLFEQSINLKNRRNLFDMLWYEFRSE